MADDLLDEKDRAHLLMRTFSTTFHGGEGLPGDGLEAAMQAGEALRQRRKADLVQQHSNAVLAGILNGADPTALISQFKYADPSIMQGMVNEQIRNRQAIEARDRQEKFQKEMADYQQRLQIEDEQRKAKKAEEANLRGSMAAQVLKAVIEPTFSGGAVQDTQAAQAPPAEVPMTQGQEGVPPSGVDIPPSMDFLSPPPSTAPPITQNPEKDVSMITLQQMLSAAPGAGVDPTQAFGDTPGTAFQAARGQMVPEQQARWKEAREGAKAETEAAFKDAKIKELEAKLGKPDAMRKAQVILSSASSYEEARKLIPLVMSTVEGVSPEMIQTILTGAFKEQGLNTRQEKQIASSMSLAEYRAAHPAMSLALSLLPPEEQAALDRAISNGLDPYKINSRTARIYARQEMMHPGRNWNDLAAAAAFERSIPQMQTEALLSTIDPLLESLAQAGAVLGNSSVPLWNRAKNFLKEHTGDETIVGFNNLRDDVIAEVERGLLGTGVLSDFKYQRALHNLNSAQSYPQMKAAVANIRTVIAARLEAQRSLPERKRKEGGGTPNSTQPPSEYQRYLDAAKGVE